jgi:hypothetical protein
MNRHGSKCAAVGCFVLLIETSASRCDCLGWRPSPFVVRVLAALDTVSLVCEIRGEIMCVDACLSNWPDTRLSVATRPVMSSFYLTLYAQCAWNP